MGKSMWAALGIVAIVAVGAGGYWYGKESGAVKAVATGPVGGAGAGGAAGSAKGAAGVPGAVTVEAIAVAQVPMPQTITAVGSIRSDESVTLRPEVTGRIAEIRFREGQAVTKGTLLVKLDASVTSHEPGSR